MIVNIVWEHLHHVNLYSAEILPVLEYLGWAPDKMVSAHLNIIYIIK